MDYTGRGGEIRAIAKFYATRLLIDEGGVDVFIDAPLRLRHREVVVTKLILPLLTRSRKKRHYRRRMNLKLISENLPTFIEHRLINELTNDEYTLTPIGREVLSECLTFPQKPKRIIKTIDEEVKNNGLG